MAIDGVQIDVPDATDNAEVFERGLSNRGMDTPFPRAQVVGLGECGTHAMIDASIGDA